MAIAYGADALGLVGSMPSGPGVIPDHLIKLIALQTPPPVSTFLLTSETNVPAIVRHHQKVHTSTIQIVDTLSKGSYLDLRKALPGIKLVQAIHVRNEASIQDALKIAPQVDALLLDSGNPTLAVKELGGTGRKHDWTLSRRIRQQAGKPVFLAGGLKPDNVQDALQTVEPFGLDLCSGIRTNGQLDEQKLAAFFAAVYA